MEHRLDGVSAVKADNEAIEDTGNTQVMEQNYGYFLSYQHYYIGDYSTIGNRGKYPIASYVTTLVQLGRGGGDYREAEHISRPSTQVPPLLAVAELYTPRFWLHWVK